MGAGRDWREGGRRSALCGSSVGSGSCVAWPLRRGGGDGARCGRNGGREAPQARRRRRIPCTRHSSPTRCTDLCILRPRLPPGCVRVNGARRPARLAVARFACLLCCRRLRRLAVVISPCPAPGMAAFLLRALASLRAFLGLRLKEPPNGGVVGWSVVGATFLVYAGACAAPLLRPARPESPSLTEAASPPSSCCCRRACGHRPPAPQRLVYEHAPPPAGVAYAGARRPAAACQSPSLAPAT